MRAGSGHQGVNTKILHENLNLDVLLCYRRSVLDNLNPASSSSKFRKDRLDSGIKWRKMPISGEGVNETLRRWRLGVILHAC